MKHTRHGQMTTKQEHLQMPKQVGDVEAERVSKRGLSDLVWRLVQLQHGIHARIQLD